MLSHNFNTFKETIFTVFSGQCRGNQLILIVKMALDVFITVQWIFKVTSMKELLKILIGICVESTSKKPMVVNDKKQKLMTDV